jgi:hypothetical protein
MFNNFNNSPKNPNKEYIGCSFKFILKVGVDCKRTRDYRSWISCLILTSLFALLPTLRINYVIYYVKMVLDV